MRSLRMLLVAVLVATTIWLVDSPASADSARPALEPVTARAGQHVVFKGRAKPRQVVKLQARGPSYWTTVGKDRASRKGAFRIAVPYPDQPLTYRVLAGGKVSRTRKVDPAATSSLKPKPPAPSDACGVRPERAGGGYYSCTFRDDFDGTALDRSKWMVQESSFSGMVGGSMGCYVDNDRTVGVSSGLLRLTSTIRPEQFLCKSPYGSWMTNAEVSTVATRSKFTQTYGRFEARLKMPAESGIPGSHSAFWLYPQDQAYGRWPASGEVDIAEWFSGLPANVYPSVHYAGENTALSSGYGCKMPTSSTAFHTYAVEWTPTVMRFYYDGALCYSHSWTPTGMSAPQPFDKPFYVVLTQVWGALWNTRTNAMADTSTLLVDYVKAWE
ncbi:glycoside hydrolase family 16 protein [Pimelobacter simplex]|uniref:glycoside hydrolase family 16 protein n=1 Tax=Nocardioides simplex TaxID=2045 RepID=UPI001931D614|nr:glycoside hydrolase family 16 protein [Pimelobacter simplex]